MPPLSNVACTAQVDLTTQCALQTRKWYGSKGILDQWVNYLTEDLKALRTQGVVRLHAVRPAAFDGLRVHLLHVSRLSCGD
jgi:hypothetical protein